MNMDTKLFSQTLINGARNYPDRPAITCRDKTITYGMLKLAADHCTGTGEDDRRFHRRCQPSGA